MKHNYLIGLGGSGGKIIAELYGRLIKERGIGFASDVECIAIDTDQDELNELAQLGVKKICISGSGNVGQIFNNLGEDVAEWCPNTANEGNFFSSSVFNGASQCRLKSRLCFSSFLKNRNNTLEQVLEESLMVSTDGEDAEEAPPMVLIASSIAGGTGSGIFIQTALYIKKFFREHNVQNVLVHGLFACPDLYKNVVSPQQLPNLYANAYAVIRELNAFNLICGPDTTSAYGGKLDIDIEISTACEGKLFQKDAKGRYGDKPYDIMYFIDRVNYLSKILGGLPEYYKAMANIAYSHLYTDISGEVLSAESNEMHAHNMAPGAIYGSAGAASIKYPYEDILEYFANRSITESFDTVWTVLDREWNNYLKEQDATARASGLAKYTPEPGERAEHFITDFLAQAKTTGVSKSSLSFLVPMTQRGGKPAVELLFAAIKENAKSAIAKDTRITNAKAECGIDDLGALKSDLDSLVANTSMTDDNSDMFSAINDIDESLEQYCKKCIGYIADCSIPFANGIFCDDKDLWEAYDKKDFGIVKGLLYNSETGEWVHPVAARYMLYSFSQLLAREINSLIGDIDTAADDADDFYNHLIEEYVEPQKTALSTNEDDAAPNAQVLQGMVQKIFGKRAARKGIQAYFEALENQLELIDEVFLDALQYFAFVKVQARVNNLIAEYERFFDNIDEFIKKAKAATAASENKHDNGKGVVYVCASAKVKNKLYEEAGRNINTQTGETASLISKGLFDSMRLSAADKSRTAKPISLKERSRNTENFFKSVSAIVASNAKDNTEIQGSLGMNVFQAMLYEYALLNPEHADDETRYSKDDAAKNRIDQFIATKLSGLAKMAAPFLVFDSQDTYSGMFNTEDENGMTVEKQKVSNAYRYISHNAEVDASIRALLGAIDGASGIVDDFYNDHATSLPKDTESQTIFMNYVMSEEVDPYTILCYSTVHCLQPYQIKAFDEIKGGVYYEHYSKRISDMEKVQKYSMTPHLDKRWHKHGVMPYINVSKEIERRYDLAKAFLYAMCYGKIGYVIEGSDAKFVYGDAKLDRDAQVIFYKGRSIPYNRINRCVNWFADQEDLIERYSALFDEAIENEVESLSKYSDNVGKYKTAITNYGRILNQLKRNIIRAIDVAESGNGKAKKTKKLEDISILDLAWKLHLSEENEVDKDYAELLVSMLCEIIKKYAKGPYNADDIENKALGSESYINYMDVCEHIATSFMQDFAKSAKTKFKDDGIISEEEAKAKKARNSFGRDDSDLDDGDVGTNVEKAFDFGVSKQYTKLKAYNWASNLMGAVVKK